MSNLSNRFPKSVFYEWEDFNRCLICGRNLPDALHHIISPACSVYKKGKFNKSILNSAPVHNFAHPSLDVGESEYCHFGQAHKLQRKETIKKLLKKTYNALTEEIGYKLQPIDYKFIAKYKELYED